MKYYKYINSKGVEVGYGTDVYNNDEYGLPMQNVEIPYEEYQLYKLKDNKIILNDELRDNALLGGVEYQGVLFDSDTDQKINLLSTVETLGDEDTIVWYGMNNEPLLCNKEDLYNIGYLIKELTTYCWTHNAEIKKAIQSAETLEELESIEINYNREEV
jgi:hypothetical protein